MWDNELYGKAITGATGYYLAGRRLHGNMVSPSVRHIGNKMAKVGAFGRTVYKAAQYINKSFSQKKKEMPPLKQQTLKQMKSRADKRKVAATKIQRAWRASKVARNKAVTVVRKHRRYYGAKDSKSKGFFAKGKRTYNDLDRLSIPGIVVARETGGTISPLGVDKVQSVMIGHSTFGCIQLRNDVARAFVKMIFNKLKIRIDDMTKALDLIRGLTIDFYYQRYPSDTTQVLTGVFTNSSTYDGMASWIDSNVLVVANGNSQFKFISLRARETDVATTPTVFGSNLLLIDLRDAEVDIYVKTALKLQNRTINSTGLTEADEVDNVPLYGKTYTGSGNWVQLGEVTVCPSDAVLSNVANISFGTSSPFAEPHSLSFVRHAKKIGKAHMDPGEIQTSLIVYKKKFNLNSIVRNYLSTSLAQGTRNTCQIGKFRYVHLEKMIQAVASTDANSIKLAYEVDHKIGIAVYAKNQPQSTYLTFDVPT